LFIAIFSCRSSLISSIIIILIGASVTAFVHPKQHRQIRRPSSCKIINSSSKDNNNHTAIQVKPKIFGHGSLCWNPGTDVILSLAHMEEDEMDHDATTSY
jgi:hypothetical protein